MIRKIIQIDREKCNGCEKCIDACHEGALAMVDGKAKLISESYCDGLGDCLPECPTGAIKIIEKESKPFDQEAVLKNMEQKKKNAGCDHAHDGCPSARVASIGKKNKIEHKAPQASESALGQWPCQIKLVPENAPFFDNAHVLVAADCTAFAYPAIHRDYMTDKVTLIGCPKLDMTDYSEKLARIFSENNLKSVTVLRMSVPCCGGLVHAVKRAMIDSGKMIPWSIVTIAPDGRIVDD